MTLTISQRRSWARHGASDVDRTITEAKRTLAEAAATRLADAKASHAAEKARRADLAAAITDEQWQAAKHVRDDNGWHKVVRINAKSATVETGYSWTDRIQRARVWQVAA